MLATAVTKYGLICLMHAFEVGLLSIFTLSFTELSLLRKDEGPSLAKHSVTK